MLKLTLKIMPSMKNIKKNRIIKYRREIKVETEIEADQDRAVDIRKKKV
jgi:hypothetical protein